MRRRTKRPVLLKLPLRTKKIFTDAKELEKNGFFGPATQQYVTYLEHFLIVVILSYWEEKDPKQAQNEQHEFLKTKIKNGLGFGNILCRIPKEINDKKIIDACKNVKEIRNQIIAHSYFVIALDKTNQNNRDFNDVNHYKKFIANLYSFVKTYEESQTVRNFLYGNKPWEIYSKLEQKAQVAETEIMKLICKYVSEKIKQIMEDITSVLYKNFSEPTLDRFF